MTDKARVRCSLSRLGFRHSKESLIWPHWGEHGACYDHANAMGPEQEVAVVPVRVCVCMRVCACVCVRACMLALLPNQQPLLQGERNLQTAMPVTPSCLLTPGWKPPGTAGRGGCSMARKLDESFDFFHLSPSQVPPSAHIQHCILCSGSQQGGWLSKKGMWGVGEVDQLD